MDDSGRLDYFWKAHSYVSDYIRFADAKAGAVIAWSTTVGGALIAKGFYDGSACPWHSIWRLAGLALLIAGALSAIAAIGPRLRTSQTRGFIFWESVLGHGGKAGFTTAAKSITEGEALKHVAEHLFDLAAICRRKYWWVNLGILLALAGSAVSGAAYLLPRFLK